MGILFVGWGGNNGTTLTSGILANKKNLTFKTKQGEKKSNYFGSLTQSVTTKIGVKFDPKTKTLREEFRLIKDIVPLANTNDLVIGGWDISSLDMY